MQSADNISKQLIPGNIRPFVIRALALIIGWNLLYGLVLSPAGIPDTQLTTAVQNGTAQLLSLFYDNIQQSGPSIFINNVQCVNIAPQCNGLELIVLYIGFILCIPTNLRKMLLYSIAGIIVIYLLNVVRCALLAHMYYNHHSLVDFAHHYAFKLAIYGVVFYGWVLYAPKLTVKNERATTV